MRIKIQLNFSTLSGIGPLRVKAEEVCEIGTFAFAGCNILFYF